MPRLRNGTATATPLPAGWEESKAPDGKTYFIDHNTKKTSWIDPRDHLIKPKTFADCIGQELPLGWEECTDPILGIYYIDHNIEINQLEDPRQQWHEQQELMLQEYLRRGESDLEAQHDLLSVKQRRLHLAQEKVDYLTNELEKYNNNTCPEEVIKIEEEVCEETMAKYNVQQLKEDITSARERVDNLKRELHKASDEVRHQQDGIKKLEKINQNVFESGPYQLDVAREKVNEMKEVKEQLLLGEQQKIQILQDLLRQRDEYHVIDAVGQKTGSMTSLNSNGSGNPSSFTGSEENLMMNMNKRQLRKDYQIARQRVHELHAALELIDYHIETSENGPEQHLFMLHNEKEALLNELDRFHMYIKTEEERSQLEYEKEMLIVDLLSTRELSTKVIEDRLQLENEKKLLKQQLAEKSRKTNLLEMKLKSLSASTLSVSSSSSRGSISTGSRGSLSTSSRGSLNSVGLHATDSFNGSDHYSNLYHHIPSTSCPPIYETHILASKAETTEGLANTTGYSSPYLSNSRVSLPNSLSPPTSPLSQNINLESVHPIRKTSYNSLASSHTTESNDRLHKNCDESSYMSYASLPLNTYQYTMGSSNDLSQQMNGTVYNAISNESVAADSGVFEASNERHKVSITRQDSGHSSGIFCGDDNIETAQIHVALDYRTGENKLTVSIEKGRNVRNVCFNSVKYVYLKGRLLPSARDEKLKFKTRKSSNIRGPSFNEQFLFKIDRNKLLNKTLQLDVFGMSVDTRKEECLGGVQISLADFEYRDKIALKWYNLLSSSFMESVRNNHSLSRSISSVSLESVPQRFNALPRVIADANLDMNLVNHGRMRSNSWQDKISMGSQSSLNSSSVGGSVERLPYSLPIPNSAQSSALLQHIRSRSEESEHQPGDTNVNRSVSDCTGCRRSFRVPFERMGVGRRSIRQSRLNEVKFPMNQQLGGLSPLQQKRISNPTQRKYPSKTSSTQNVPNVTSLDLELELQSAYSKQEKLNEEILRLKEFKYHMEEQDVRGGDDFPQWLMENGNNLDALLVEAQKEVSFHLSGQSSLLDSSNKYTYLSKTNPRQAKEIGFQDKMRSFTANKPKVPANPDIHWV